MSVWPNDILRLLGLELHLNLCVPFPHLPYPVEVPDLPVVASVPVYTSVAVVSSVPVYPSVSSVQES